MVAYFINSNGGYPEIADIYKLVFVTLSPILPLKNSSYVVPWTKLDVWNLKQNYTTYIYTCIYSNDRKRLYAIRKCEFK